MQRLGWAPQQPNVHPPIRDEIEGLDADDGAQGGLLGKHVRIQLDSFPAIRNLIRAERELLRATSAKCEHEEPPRGDGAQPTAVSGYRSCRARG